MLIRSSHLLRVVARGIHASLQKTIKIHHFRIANFSNSGRRLGYWIECVVLDNIPPLRVYYYYRDILRLTCDTEKHAVHLRVVCLEL